MKIILKNKSMYYNKDLENNLDNIKLMQENEETDAQKLTVSLQEDDNLDVSLIIDIEDHSYFYHNNEERLNDYEMLVDFLTKNSKEWVYY